MGELGAHLKLIGKALRIDVKQRGNAVHLNGEEAEVRVGVALLEQLYGLVGSGFALHPRDVRHAIRVVQKDPGADVSSFFQDTVIVGIGGKPISPRTAGQAQYVQTLRTHDIVFGVGPAGTGKTYLAMAVAVSALQRNEVKRIVLTRPAVEAGEKLGFLPGDLSEKVDPYLRPLYDAIGDMIPGDRIARLLEKGVLEVAPLAFMRGRTLSDAYVLLDEAQNTTIEQMRMFLTRLGDNSRMVITGDITQTDLPNKRHSGMAHALRLLGHLERIGVVHFTSADVVRHPLVAEIIEAYEADDRRREEARERRKQDVEAGNVPR